LDQRLTRCKLVTAIASAGARVVQPSEVRTADQMLTMLRDKDEAWETMVNHLMARGLKLHEASIAAGYFMEVLKVVENNLAAHGVSFE